MEEQKKNFFNKRDVLFTFPCLLSFSVSTTPNGINNKLTSIKIQHSGRFSLHSDHNIDILNEGCGDLSVGQHDFKEPATASDVMETQLAHSGLDVWLINIERLEEYVFHDLWARETFQVTNITGIKCFD